MAKVRSVPADPLEGVHQIAIGEHVDPYLELAIHKKSSRVVIVKFAPDRERGCYSAWGDLVVVEWEEMVTEGLAVVLANMDGFWSRDPGDGWVLKEKRREEQKLTRESYTVGAFLRPKDVLELHPMHSLQGGGSGSERDEIVHFQLSGTNEGFLGALNEALDALR